MSLQRTDWKFIVVWIAIFALCGLFWYRIYWLLKLLWQL